MVRICEFNSYSDIRKLFGISQYLSMVDTTKSSDSQTPLSPQIKVPLSPPPFAGSLRPSPGGASGQAAGTKEPSVIPPNLPIKEVVPPFQAPKPPTPPPFSPSVAQPPKPEIPRSTPAPSPAASPQPPVFKSTIRTMQDDLAAINKGQAPSGLQVEKQSEGPAKTAPEGPKVTPPPKPTEMPRVDLGKLEKSRPLAGALPPLSFPSAPSAPTGLPSLPTINIPSVRSNRLIIYTIAGIVAIAIGAGLVWFFAIRQPQVAVSPTPTRTTSPTPSVSTSASATPSARPQIPLIEMRFGSISSVSIASGSNLLQRAETAINKTGLMTGKPVLFKLFNTSGSRFNFADVAMSSQAGIPTELLSAVDSANPYFSLQLKTDKTYGRAFILRLKNANDISGILNKWEVSMTSDLKNLFQINTQRAQSSVFLNNVYRGVTIRYRNFPDPNKTIDYGAVTMSSDEKYLIFADSREHMYAVIDKLLGSAINQ